MRRFSPLRLSALLAFVAILLAACGSSSDSSNAAETGGGSEALVAQTVSGAEFDFASLDGQPALVWFWAPW